MSAESPYQFLDYLASFHVTKCTWVPGSGSPKLRRDVYLRECDVVDHIDQPSKRVGLAFIEPGTSTCRTALFDLDDHRKKLSIEEVIAKGLQLSEQARLHGLKAWLNTSSGGRGVHVRFFWSEQQDAYSVRQLLASIAEKCGLKNGTGGLEKGEVEIFPKQDSVPADGFGNMAWLPFNSESQLVDEKGRIQSITAVIGTKLPMSDPVPVQEKPVSTKREHAPIVNEPELQRIQSALDAIPNETDGLLEYHDWLRVIYALHYATDGDRDTGLVMALAFSERSPRYVPGRKGFTDVDADVWQNADKRESDREVTQEFIYALARKYGWEDPNRFDGMEPLPYSDVYVGPAGSVLEMLKLPIEDTNAEPPSAPPAGHKDRALFAYSSPEDFIKRPKPTWHVRNILPATEIAMIYGESGVGKSFVALDMACAIARGVDWWGHRVRKGRVGYVIAEGAGGLGSRLEAHVKARGIDPAALRDLAIINAAPNLLEVKEAAKLVDTLRAAFGGQTVDVLFIDTVARVTPGANENSGEDMGKFLKLCEEVQRLIRGTVVLIHHAGKDIARGARGWSGIKAAMDAEIELAWDGSRRSLRTSKMKDGRDDLQHLFNLTEVVVGVEDDEEMTEITSCVVDPVVESAEESARATVSGEDAYMRDLEKLRGVQRYVADELRKGGREGSTVLDLARHIARKYYDEKAWDKQRDNVKRTILTMGTNGLVEIRGEQGSAGTVHLCKFQNSRLGGVDELGERLSDLAVVPAPLTPQSGVILTPDGATPQPLNEPLNPSNPLNEGLRANAGPPLTPHLNSHSLGVEGSEGSEALEGDDFEGSELV